MRKYGKRRAWKKAMHEGIEIEKEHKRTYNLFKKKKGRMSPRSFYANIAKDHIKEAGTKYYDVLEKMEDRLKKKTRKKRY